MITFNKIGTQGRLGNQMFQYAALFSVANKCKYRFGIPYKNKHSNPYFNLQLNDYFLNLTAEDSSDINQVYFYNEPKFTYNESIFHIEDNTDILGYFQSEKYFKNLKNQIKKEFQFSQQTIEKTNSILSKFMEPPISLHMRIGDYRFWGDKHPICQFEYYNQALDKLPKSSPILIFSDEPNVAAEYLKNLNRFYSIFVDNKPDEDLCLMTKCDYHIIANSSFSWWGAWLSDTKQVIAPKKWFGGGSDMPQDWSDIYCEGWEVI
jgi:hypothetical protein